MPVDLRTAFVWTLITDTLRAHAPQQYARTVTLSDGGRALEHRLTPAERRAARVEAKKWLDTYPLYRTIEMPPP